MENIPKILHLYWDGAPMSWLHTLTIESFHKYNPDWEIMLYLPVQDYRTMGENRWSAPYTAKDYFDRVYNFPYLKIEEIDLNDYGIPMSLHGAQISDILSEKWLYKYGGVYCDMDVIWLRPIADLVATPVKGNPFDFDAIVSFYKFDHDYHSVGVLISEPGSRFTQAVVNIQENVRPPYRYEDFGSQMLIRHFRSLQDVWSMFPRVMAVKYETFYPYHVYTLERLYNMVDMEPMETNNPIALHWFNGHHLSKDYINKEDYNRECSLSKILQQEGYVFQ